MQSTHTAQLPLPSLPSQATTAHIFPTMAKSLLGAGPLCDAGCTIHLNQDGGCIHCLISEPIALSQHSDGLWTLANLTNNPGATPDRQVPLTTVACVATHPTNHGMPADIMAFYHATLWSLLSPHWRRQSPSAIYLISLD